MGEAMVREARQTLGLSQQKMADACGVHKQTWIKWERGERCPDRAALRLIAALLYLDEIGRLEEFLSGHKGT